MVKVRIDPMRLFREPIVLLWKHRSMLLQTTRNDIRARYAGSVLGLIWLFLYPLMFLGAYAFMMVAVGSIRNLWDSPDKIILIFCGLIPFIGFAEALGMGVTAVSANANLIKNTLFPIELMPVRVVLSSQCTQVVGSFTLLIVLAVFHKLTLWALLLPVVWLCQVLFSFGLIWILSSLNVYFRDLQNIIGVMTLILMMVSPIYWTPDMIPETLRPFMGINPLYYIIISHQECLMFGRFPQGMVFWGLMILAVVFFFLGFGFFRRMKRVFADNV